MWYVRESANYCYYYICLDILHRDLLTEKISKLHDCLQPAYVLPPASGLSGRQLGPIMLCCKIWNGVASDDPSIAIVLGLGPGGNCERLVAAGAHTSDSKLSPHSVETALASLTIHCPNPPNTDWKYTAMTPAVQHRKRFLFHYNACLMVIMSIPNIAINFCLVNGNHNES